MIPNEHKILHIITLSEWGGAQQVCYDIVTSLKDSKLTVEVACAPGGELVDRLRDQGIHVHTINRLRRDVSPLNDLRALFALYRIMGEGRYDLIHCHSTKAGILGRLGAMLTSDSIIMFTAHGWVFTEDQAYWKRWFLAQLERLLAKVATKIICVSAYDRDLALHFKVSCPAKLIVICNGIDPYPFSQAQGSELRQQWATGRAPVLAFVGRLAPQKDPLTLLEATRQLSEVKLLLVGDGPLRAEVERFIRENGLVNRVLLTGVRADIPDILAASDVFVSPSRWEGLPLAVIEAMMAGLPVVATRVGGVPELVEDGVTGFLVSPRDPEALTAAIQKLLDNEDLRCKMGQLGRRKALSHFTLERMLAQTQEVYQKVFREQARRIHRTSS